MEILSKFVLLLIVGAILSAVDGRSAKHATDVIEETEHVVEEIVALST